MNGFTTFGFSSFTYTLAFALVRTYFTFRFAFTLGFTHGKLRLLVNIDMDGGWMYDRYLTMIPSRPEMIAFESLVCPSNSTPGKFDRLQPPRLESAPTP